MDRICVSCYVKACLPDRISPDLSANKVSADFWRQMRRPTCHMHCDLACLKSQWKDSRCTEHCSSYRQRLVQSTTDIISMVKGTMDNIHEYSLDYGHIYKHSNIVFNFNHNILQKHVLYHSDSNVKYQH